MARKPAGERRPKAAAAREFYDYATKEGWSVSNRAWPDYFCIRLDRNGRTQVAVVEVAKHRGRKVKSAQHQLMLILQTAGIPCYRFTPDSGLQEFQIMNPTSRGIKGDSVDVG